MPETEWAGQVAVVTGAGGAMGQALVAQLTAKGVKVAGLDRAESLKDADGFLAVPTDVGSAEAVRDAYATVDRELGPVSLLVNFAAMNSSPESVLDMQPDEWTRVLDVNLNGTFWNCQEALRRMMPARKGSIVNISSLNGFMGRRQFPTHAYAVSKSAVIGLTTTLASEVGKHGVRVNCVAPGLHKSPMAFAVAGSETATDEFFAGARESTPLDRVADAAEMAGPVMFLLSEASGYMTGQLLVSDGGRSTWYV
ncbi:SDR family oxidoreductase [Actinoplanes bogorensis]|uniref:SDR family oxidoreductase n=1 Tax=Paractinoplanes bogorensis TaxID=1610840 RepID=A0ABS5YUQ7_9ACTN|nr:SDR family NAD(P)-dependent oxidoreductase [Actinoplanes bogorensis]MBU2667183.1 SDR family oxidoreductase [Actinoplanes bogorensis]